MTDDERGERTMRSCSSGTILSDPATEDGTSEAEVQENIDQAVEAVVDLEFATLEEVKEGFRS